MENQTENTSKQGMGFVFGLLAGSLIGAATAIILAPQSGRQTRELIKRKALEAKATTTAKAAELKQKAETTAAELKVKADHTVDELKTRAEAKAAELKTKATEVANELKEDLGEWTEKTKAKVVSKFKDRVNKEEVTVTPTN